MTLTDDRTREGILVLGAGQLGMAVLRALGPRLPKGSTFAVLERPAIVESTEAEHRARIAEIESLGATVLPLDIAAASKGQLIDAL